MFHQQNYWLQVLLVYGVSPLWVLSNIYPNFGHFRSKLQEPPAFGDVSAAKVLVASLAGEWLFSFLGPLLNIYPNFGHFRSKLLETPALGDVSAAKVLVASFAGEWLFSFVGPVKYLSQLQPFSLKITRNPGVW